ncbi:MAG: hypothetical protein LAP38_00580 [Acidobacteriia bacterium]|nr:hypothetical protein [Terriglobia bacterium]
MESARESREPHVQCYQSAELTLLGAGGYSISGHVINLTGQNMRIVVNQPVGVKIAASIRVGDWLAFGEVYYCELEHSHYAVGLRLDQVVMGLRELDALRRNRLNERADALAPQ